MFMSPDPRQCRVRLSNLNHDSWYAQFKFEAKNGIAGLYWSETELRSGWEIRSVSLFGRYISPGCRISDEMTLDVRKTWLALTNLGKLWCRCDSRLLVKDQVFAASRRLMLLYDSEMCPLRTVNIERLGVWTPMLSEYFTNIVEEFCHRFWR